MQELITKIEQWAIDRELDKKATVEAQSIKTAEEMAELIIGISKDNIEVIKDSIGDVFVTLVIGNMIDKKLDVEEIYKTTLECVKSKIVADKKMQILCLNEIMQGILEKGYDEITIGVAIGNMIGNIKVYDLTLVDCIESAYNEIKDRKGKTVNGQFIKESDLRRK